MIYKTEDYNSDKLSEPFETTQKGNSRYVAEHRDGFRRYIRYANAHSGKAVNILWGDIGFPVVPVGEIRSQQQVNKRAVEQGFITQADYDHFYGV